MSLIEEFDDNGRLPRIGHGDEMFNVHPAAALFPRIEGERFEELVEDIRRRGLQNPITLSHDGSTIVDGVQRYPACYEAIADPAFILLGPHYDEAETIRYIVATNLIRVDLTDFQRAALMVETSAQAEAAQRARR
jgi:ParB-like chromosome segregation protein Spo0J